MRKPRDFDAQLKVLNEKAKQLKDRKIRQYGDLVIATGADALDIETLAGALVLITEQADAARKESWRRKGEVFFENSRTQLHNQLKMTLRAERRLKPAINRTFAVLQRLDHTAWVMDRRARTRKLIELGGLVQKSGLVTVANDDRALILGALVLAAWNLENPEDKEKRERWRAIGEEEMGASSNSWSGR